MVDHRGRVGVLASGQEKNAVEVAVGTFTLEPDIDFVA